MPAWKFSAQPTVVDEEECLSSGSCGSPTMATNFLTSSTKQSLHLRFARQTDYQKVALGGGYSAAITPGSSSGSDLPMYATCRSHSRKTFVRTGSRRMFWDLICPFLAPCSLAIAVTVLLLYSHVWTRRGTATSTGSTVTNDKITESVRSSKVHSNSLHGVLGRNANGTSLWTVPLDPLPEGAQLDSHMKLSGGMNRALSDRIPLDRMLYMPVELPPQCSLRKHFPSTLTVSVVIPVHDEGPSFLLRTLHALFNRTPDQLLRDVVIVDDGSAGSWFSEPRAGLGEYLKVLPAKITIVRSSVRMGIARAKNLGARHAKGDIIVFLDGHTEVGVGWIQPIVQRISANPKTIVFPETVMINPRTLMVQGSLLKAPVGFQWKLLEQAIVDQREATTAINRGEEVDHFLYPASPVLPSGMFAADKLFLQTLNPPGSGFGGFDDQLSGMPGMENLELSFKVWQFGGRIESSRCSLIGHVFREGRDLTAEQNSDSKQGSATIQIIRNKIRCALLWMDDAAALSYWILGRPELLTIGDLGGSEFVARYKWLLAHRVHEFGWYMSSVYPDSTFRSLPDASYGGRVLNAGSMYCMDQGKGRHLPGQRPVTLVNCLDYDEAMEKHRNNMIFVRAHPERGTLFNLMHPLSQQWFLYNAHRKVIHPGSNDEACLGSNNRVEQTSTCFKEPWTWTLHLVNEDEAADLGVPEVFPDPGTTTKWLRIRSEQRSQLCLTSPDRDTEPSGQVSIPILMGCTRTNIYQVWSWEVFKRPEVLVDLQKILQE